MKKKFFIIVLLLCGCGTVEKSTQNIREEVRVIQKQTRCEDSTVQANSNTESCAHAGCFSRGAADQRQRW